MMDIHSSFREGFVCQHARFYAITFRGIGWGGGGTMHGTEVALELRRGTISLPHAGRAYAHVRSRGGS